MRRSLFQQALQDFPLRTFRLIQTWLFGAFCPVLNGTARPLTGSVLCLFGGWRPVRPSLYCFSGRWCLFFYCLWLYMAFFLWLSWPYMASFMATTPAVPSLRLRLPRNIDIRYLLALTAPAFAVSGRFQPFLES